jgi:hypothetical protein
LKYGKPVQSNLSHGSFQSSGQRSALMLLFIAALFCLDLSGQQDMAQKKRIFAEKLDSIDIEKQLRKRKGESIVGLERLAESYKDSIADLKMQMAQGNEALETKNESRDTSARGAGQGIFSQISGVFKFLPRTLFDWVVVIVGCIAIVSGIILFVGLIGLLSKGFTRRKKPPRTLHDLFPQIPERTAEDVFPKVGETTAEENNETIDLVRKRMQETAVSESEKNSILAIFDEQSRGAGQVPDAPAVSGPSDREQKAASAKEWKNTPDIKKQVVRAMQEGLDVSDISKKFHISADEVSLILRLARQDDNRTQ